MSHPHDPLTLPIVAALGGGVVLFVAFTAAAVWRSSRSLLIPRIGILTLTSAALVLTIDKDPKYALGLIAGGLFLIDAIEWKKCRRPLVADR